MIPCIKSDGTLMWYAADMVAIVCVTDREDREGHPRRKIRANICINALIRQPNAM